LTNGPHLEHDLLTPTEVLEYLRVTVRTVYRLMRTGDLPAVRVDLDAWLRRQPPEPPWDRRPPDAREAEVGSQPTRVPSSHNGDQRTGERV
jgi:hypothetical protein